MNEDQLLQLQAWVDGELPEGEARRIEKQLETDADAQALVAELRMTKSFLQGNEPQYQLSESRQFYWSKIQREIERGATVPSRPGVSTWLMAWRRLLVPVSGLAVIAFATVLSLKFARVGGVDDPLQHLVEAENLNEDIGSIAYKSQSENMFVVYLYNKDREPAAEDDWEFIEESALQ